MESINKFRLVLEVNEHDVRLKNKKPKKILNTYFVITTGNIFKVPAEHSYRIIVLIYLLINAYTKPLFFLLKLQALTDYNFMIIKTAKAITGNSGSHPQTVVSAGHDSGHSKQPFRFVIKKEVTWLKKCFDCRMIVLMNDP